MKKNSTQTINKKIAKYTAAAGALAAVGSSANAQIVYTDVDPDYVLSYTGTPLGVSLDINGDGNNDFVIAIWGDGSVTAALAAPFATGSNCAGGNPNNEMMGNISPYSYPYISKLNSGQAIGAAGPWIGANCETGTLGYYVIGQGSPYGEEWNNGVTDGFMGVKFDIGGSIHYGWVRMDVSADQATVTIKDMAYQATANTPINAGDMGLSSVTENLAGKVGIFEYNRMLNINIDDIELTNVRLSMINISGQLVKETNLVNRNNQININDLAAGVYIVTVTTDQGMYSQKIAIK